MRVIASFAAAASLAATAVVVGPASPASAYPSGALVLVATPPPGSSVLAAPVTCVVQAGSQTTGDINRTAWYGSIDCTSPVSMSGTAWLGLGVWHFREAAGSSFSCSNCTSGRSTGSSTNTPGVAVTRFEFDVTAPAGYTWQVAQDASYASNCGGTGTATFSCNDFTSVEWVNVGV